MWFRRFFLYEENEISLRSALPDPSFFLNDVRKINRALGREELREIAASFFSVHDFEFDFHDVQFRRTFHGRKVSQFILRCRVALMRAMPEYEINWLMYPRAFDRFYAAAAFRPDTIAEFETFVDDVVELEKTPALEREIRGFSPNATFEGMVEAYLGRLFDLYVDEYHYEKAEALMKTLGNRGMLRGGQVSNFFRKTNRLDDGIKFIEGTVDRGRSREAEFKLALQTMKHQKENLKPFKAKPAKKKKTLKAKLIRYER